MSPVITIVATNSTTVFRQKQGLDFSLRIPPDTQNFTLNLFNLVESASSYLVPFPHHPLLYQAESESVAAAVAF